MTTTLEQSLRVGAAPPGRNEAGFTLIEMLIALLILPLIIGAISFSFILIISQHSTVGASIADSSDAQVLSEYYVQDVQAAQEVTTYATASGQCGPTAAGAVQLLGLEWGGYGSGVQQYQTVVSYDRVQTEPGTYSLVRYYCSSGPSLTPSLTTTVSKDISLGQGVPTITPSGPAALALLGWTSTVGVTGVSITLTEPGSNFTYTLTGVPEPGTNPTVAPVKTNSPFSGCGATPGTGNYANSLCFVSFSGFSWSTATGTGQGCSSGGQPMSQGLAGTPFTLSFCVKANASGDQVGGHAIPTYYGAGGQGGSEAFLGNNGFYTGIPGLPALYQCSTSTVPLPVGCPNNVPGGDTNLSFYNIQVTNPSGISVTGWQLVAGDAESTDTGEWIAWTTCPSIAKGSGTTSVDGGPPNDDIYSGTNCTSSDPDLTLLPNSPTSPYGNACSYTSYTYTGNPLDPTGGTYAEWTAGSTTGTPSITPAAPNTTNSVECAENEQLNKTGTVMLEAPSPSTLTVNMNGTGAQAVFIGVLL
jgi:prepilin-type N-terminal cleavage/methylation domain-containing protein